jgi:hypothetical protein
MRRESHVRFCEGLRGRFPRATRLAAAEFYRLACRKSPKTVIGNIVILY